MAESPSELQAEIEKLERKHAENPEGRYFVPLANAYRKLGSLEQAEQLLREGLRRHPDYLSAHIVLGRCLADRQANAEAADEFRYVLSLDAQNLIALRTLGELALADGSPEEAARWFNDLLAVDPMNEDARRALESLNASASAADASEEFQQGAAWWERPAEPGVQPQEESQPQEYGIRELREPGTAPVREQAEPEPPAAAVPAEPGAAWPDLDREAEGAEEVGEVEPVAGEGLVAVDGGSGLWKSVEVGVEEVEPETESPELVTETIAELYARQGLYDRSIEVYRELIRRRGGSEALEKRLAEVERLAASSPSSTAEAAEEGAPTEWAEQPIASAPEAEWLTPDAPLTLEDETAPALPEEPAAAEEEPGARDLFAASFREGFEPADAREEIGPEPVDVSAAEETAEALETTEVEEELEPLPLPAGWEEEPQGESEPVAARGATIAELLGQLAAWRPSGGEPAAAAPAPSPLPAAGPAEASAPDEEPFPWELPPADQAAGGPAEEPEELSGARAEEEPPAASAPAPPPTAPPAPPAPAAEAEEDDLESFQSWLRSLKR